MRIMGCCHSNKTITGTRHVTQGRSEIMLGFGKFTIMHIMYIHCNIVWTLLGYLVSAITSLMS